MYCYISIEQGWKPFDVWCSSFITALFSSLGIHDKDFYVDIVDPHTLLLQYTVKLETMFQIPAANVVLKYFLQ